MVLFSEVDEIIVAKKSGFDWCTNKKLRKILAKIRQQEIEDFQDYQI